VFKSLYMMMIVQILLTAGNVMAMTDPMQPPNFRGTQTDSGSKDRPRWLLTSTLISKNRKLATINGRTVGKGAKVSGGQIIDIKPASVTILYKKQPVVVYLLRFVDKHVHKISSE